MIDKKVLLGHCACFTAYAIFGVNIITTKDLTAGHLISPIGIFCLRAIATSSIFWLISFFMPGEKVARRDFPKIFLASLLGFFLTQITFLTASPLITPMSWSVLSSVTPIFTMFIAAIALKEPISLKKAAGVLLSFVGIICLILSSSGTGGGPETSSLAGYVLAILNSFGFALYLGVFRPLIVRYSVVTFMKWIFLFAFLMSAPFAAGELLRFDFSVMEGHQILDLAFLIIFATFVSYFLIPLGQKHIRPTLVSLYSYLQPIFAIAISICIGMDTLDAKKVIASLAVVGGVLLVSFSRSASPRESASAVRESVE